MSDPDHSPTLWTLGDEHESMCNIISEEGVHITITHDLPHHPRPHDVAERIIRCVNDHDELVKEHRDLMESCRTVIAAWNKAHEPLKGRPDSDTIYYSRFLEAGDIRAIQYALGRCLHAESGETELGELNDEDRKETT